MTMQHQFCTVTHQDVIEGTTVCKALAPLCCACNRRVVDQDDPHEACFPGFLQQPFKLGQLFFA